MVKWSRWNGRVGPVWGLGAGLGVHYFNRRLDIPWFWTETT